MARKEMTELKEIKAERDALRRHVDELERIVARCDPAAILSKLPAGLEQYQPDLPNKVVALAAVGIASTELRTELGITREQQTQWKKEHPTFAVALARAKDLAYAYWQRRSRQALESKDWKYPYNQVQRFIETMAEEAEQEPVDRGDASTRIVLFADDCPQCGYSQSETTNGLGH